MEQAISYVTIQLEMGGVLDEATVILIGSASRDTMRPRSDVDLLVVTPTAIRRMSVPVTMHIHLDTRDGFIAGVLQGDDFRGWALRFGRVVHDPSSWWPGVVADDRMYPWPDWQAKLAHAEKRVRMGRMAIEDGDLGAAHEEYLMAISHVARAQLLREGVYPLSRPELPDQLIQSGYSSLGQLLGTFIRGVEDWETLKEGAEAVSSIVARLRTVPEMHQPSKQWPLTVRDEPRRCK